jgi:hypothetical protein
VELLLGRQFQLHHVALQRSSKRVTWGLQLCAVMENDPTTVGKLSAEPEPTLWQPRPQPTISRSTSRSMATLLATVACPECDQP